MQYTVKITSYATSQICGIIKYISNVLLVPNAASSLLDKLQEEINGLAMFPERYPVLDKEPWKSRNVRRMQVNNFLVYFYTKEETAEVWVFAVIYGRRNQAEALKNSNM